ncbi:MAG TPA: DAK2 domain-containing protein [Patescibacteria group bacterium]|nr:DAK2 domain-containing protein [Patescibacteria group bacterium]
MSGSTPTDVLLGVAAALHDARDELNRLDAVAGDGDLGLTAARAADALAELAPSVSADDPQAAARSIGMALARKAPSTGGTLVAFACLAAARVAPIPGETGVELSARLLEAARDEIATRGKVAPGDRTMLDALDPAAVAFRTAAGQGAPAAEALEAAADAAETGAGATADMEATTGRAGWLADRARGHEDAGATLIAIVIRAAADAVRAAAD